MLSSLPLFKQVCPRGPGASSIARPALAHIALHAGVLEGLRRRSERCLARLPAEPLHTQLIGAPRSLPGHQPSRLRSMMKHGFASTIPSACMYLTHFRSVRGCVQWRKRASLCVNCNVRSCPEAREFTEAFALVTAPPLSSGGPRARVERRGASAQGASRCSGFGARRRCGSGRTCGTFAGTAAAPSSSRMTSWLRRMSSSRCAPQSVRCEAPPPVWCLVINQGDEIARLSLQAASAESASGTPACGGCAPVAAAAHARMSLCAAGSAVCAPRLLALLVASEAVLHISLGADKQCLCLCHVCSLLQESVACSAEDRSCLGCGACLGLVCVAVRRTPVQRTDCAGSCQAAVRWQCSLACSGLPAGLQRPIRCQGCSWGALPARTGHCSLRARHSPAAGPCPGVAGAASGFWGRCCWGLQRQRAARLKLPTREAGTLALLLGAERTSAGWSTVARGARGCSAPVSVTARYTQLLRRTLRPPSWISSTCFGTPATSYGCACLCCCVPIALRSVRALEEHSDGRLHQALGSGLRLCLSFHDQSTHDLCNDRSIAVLLKIETGSRLLRNLKC